MIRLFQLLSGRTRDGQRRPSTRLVKIDNKMNVAYDHSGSVHLPKDARTILPYIFEIFNVASVVDVGCGNGSWLFACSELGVEDYLGLDGIDIEHREYLADPTKFRVIDLLRPTPLERKFDLALCLEVGEHLPESAAYTLISLLSDTAEVVLFSAACPGQMGQNHINCQWPEYWANLFRGCGMKCSDTVRFKFWNEEGVESYYRQNMFIATRLNTSEIFDAPIAPIIHPDMLRRIDSPILPTSRRLNMLIEGRASGRTYAEIVWRFLRRRFSFSNYR